MRLKYVCLIAMLAAVVCAGCGKKMLPPAKNMEELRLRLGSHTNEFVLALASARAKNYPAALAIIDHLASDCPEIPEYRIFQRIFRRDQSNQLAAAFPPAAARRSSLRPRVSIEQLKPADRQSVDKMMQRMADVGQASPPTRQALATALLADVKKLTLDQPNLTRGWLMQARLARLLNRPLEGQIAGQNLAELRAWETINPQVINLLVQLIGADWLPVSGLDADAAAALQNLAAEQGRLDAANADAAARAELLTRIKAFNLAHPAQPGGWLLQYDLARQLNRAIDQSVALDQLAALRT